MVFSASACIIPFSLLNCREIRLCMAYRPNSIHYSIMSLFMPGYVLLLLISNILSSEVSRVTPTWSKCGRYHPYLDQNVPCISTAEHNFVMLVDHNWQRYKYSMEHFQCNEKLFSFSKPGVTHFIIIIPLWVRDAAEFSRSFWRYACATINSRINSIVHVCISMDEYAIEQ